MTHTIEVPNLGETPKPGMHRDAVHIAVIPVVAGERLYPGDKVGRYPDGSFMRSDDPIGVVDPFLPKRGLLLGDSFWLFLFPGSITSLRHVWTHPEFKVNNHVVGSD